MPRSTLRAAGALCLTATTVVAAPAAAQTAAQAPALDVGAKRLNVRVGSRVTVSGHASAPTAALQVRRGSHWITLDRAHTSPSGRFVLQMVVEGGCACGGAVPRVGLRHTLEECRLNALSSSIHSAGELA